MWETSVNRKYLTIVLTINFSFFAIEIIMGIISNSMGLVADSLDMLADALSNEVHIKTSIIFTSNDIIINIGIVAAGVFVLLMKSNVLDLMVGAIVFTIVLRGSIRILQLGNR